MAPAAHEARPLLRPRSSRSHHPSRADRGQMVHPYLNRRSAPRAGDVRPSLISTDPRAHARRAALSGAAPAHGDGARRLHRRRGRGAAPRHGIQALGRADEEIEARLRSGMVGARDRRKVQTTSCAASPRSRCTFPESHAASFALLAYASAYLRAHHLAAFTCAMLNNWRWLYHPRRW